ncbi:MAG: molybdopterin molybdotransferase MoeA [Syntrophaceticus schinkii]|jgi:molybdopterin molybdotransferase|nr:molybdopterin molybdotransferase MoeA [Syntrophaceticus schinkii]MDD4260947.1 molybdopterin molybdotransferase MoeA [Syntrophaceticus schinkii]MDD4674077.1 molybdopterin molybdotransferase MoeA [Syntrophaceticus schinkii]
MMLERPPMEDARQALVDKIMPLESEALPTMEAVKRILAADIIAPRDLPPYRQAAMDGFAVSLTETKDKRFTIKKILEADEAPDFSLEPGEAAGVLTGGYVPQGTDVVIRQEDVRIIGDSITVDNFPVIDNIRNQGEDIKSGSVIARSGTIITPGLIAILTAFGLREIRVIRRPKVAILSLGKEVIPYDQDLTPGQMWDSNGPHLSSLVTIQGGLPSVVVSQSSPEKILHSQLQQADMVVTIGGTADGSNDQGRDLLDSTCAEPVFLGYQVKPGSHACAGVSDGKPVIMLSGNPMACFVGYCLLVSPALRALQGLNPEIRRFPAVATSPFPKPGGPRRFLLGYALCGEEGWRVAVLPAQRPSMRQSLADCNCLIDLPPGHPPVQPGAEVFIIPIQGLV